MSCILDAQSTQSANRPKPRPTPTMLAPTKFEVVAQHMTGWNSRTRSSWRPRSSPSQPLRPPQLLSLGGRARPGASLSGTYLAGLISRTRDRTIFSTAGRGWYSSVGSGDVAHQTFSTKRPSSTKSSSSITAESSASRSRPRRSNQNRTWRDPQRWPRTDPARHPGNRPCGDR
jgi:hypothetical protein